MCRVYRYVFTGDIAGIAGRKPYGLDTKMFRCIGWTRLESTRIFRFNGVDEKNFPSILRRSLVWMPKARFLDSDYLNKHYPNHQDIYLIS